VSRGGVVEWPALKPRYGWGQPLVRALIDADVGEIIPITLVTDNGGACKGAVFATFIAGRRRAVHVRTRHNSRGQNGVREGAFGPFRYEHPLRHEIADLPTLAREAGAHRQVVNHV